MRTINDSAETLYSAAELASDAGVSVRTVRFYEERELLQPRRVGSTRVYSGRDAARLSLILRGKRLGFSLSEIKTYLALYDVEPHQRAQRAWLHDQVSRQISRLEQQAIDVREALDELYDIAEQTTEALEISAAVSSKTQPSSMETS
jgi:DNA-binding transcriptional MerR regulator